MRDKNIDIAAMILAYLGLSIMMGFMIYSWCLARSLFLALGKKNKDAETNGKSMKRVKRRKARASAPATN